MRKAEKDASDRQREAKYKKVVAMRKKKLLAVQAKYANALTYIDMYHSPACWKTATQARKEFNKLSSYSARLEAAKEQI